MKKYFYEDTYDFFKPVRNLLKKYYKKDIIHFCLSEFEKIWGLNLLDVTKNKLPNPWKLFLILKWGVIYGEESNYSSKNFGYGDFAKVYDKLESVDNSSKFLNEKDDLSIWKFFRALMNDESFMSN